MTKHEQLLDYIRQLPVGRKLSVRGIARKLGVSEGTAYRAIKEAEQKRLVSTIGRVGTLRIGAGREGESERLTFAEVIKIVDGTAIGGKEGLHKSLGRFVIGAMEVSDMMRYIDGDSLLLVGNRKEAQRQALAAGAAVLVTGGFDVDEELKRQADRLGLPILSSGYDTFTVASMLHRAIDDRLIQGEVRLVSDILTPLERVRCLSPRQTVADYETAARESGHAVFPVTDSSGALLGILSPKDILQTERSEPISKHMTRQPVAASLDMSLAAATQRMILEGVDLLPIVGERQRLLGIVSRSDVLKALQPSPRGALGVETLDEAIVRQMKLPVDGAAPVEFLITPQLTNGYGSLSYGALVTMFTEAGARRLERERRSGGMMESMSVYFLQPAPIDETLAIETDILELGRKSVKLDCTARLGRRPVAKALVTFRVLE